MTNTERQPKEPQRIYPLEFGNTEGYKDLAPIPIPPDEVSTPKAESVTAPASSSVSVHPSELPAQTEETQTQQTPQTPPDNPASPDNPDPVLEALTPPSPAAPSVPPPADSAGTKGSKGSSKQSS